MLNAFRDFLRLESASGIILVVAAALAMIIANSPLAGIYGLLVELPVEIRVGNFEIAKRLELAAHLRRCVTLRRGIHDESVYRFPGL